jgi:prolyl oligopeptidase
VTGASNGGLVAAAMVAQQPSLFWVAVAWVPLTDMLRYQDVLLGKIWSPEYGSSADAHMFPVLLVYSPYHNVKSGVRYAAVLLTAADSDGRVDPMHTCKLAAALQCATASDAPVLPRVETRAGHGSGKAIGKQVGEYADMFGFVMSELGMLEKPAGGADAAQPR